MKTFLFSLLFFLSLSVSVAQSPQDILKKEYEIEIDEYSEDGRAFVKPKNINGVYEKNCVYAYFQYTKSTDTYSNFRIVFVCQSSTPIHPLVLGISTDNGGMQLTDISNFENPVFAYRACYNRVDLPYSQEGVGKMIELIKNTSTAKYKLSGRAFYIENKFNKNDLKQIKEAFELYTNLGGEL